MKRTLAILLILVALFSTAACARQPAAVETVPSIEPKVSQMKSICELAVMECYYHNVAKYREQDAAGFLWWTKDKHFWIEYSGVVKLGVDASLVNISIDGDTVTVTLPDAAVLSCRVDSSSLNENSYIVAKDSAAITAEDEIAAFSEAQKRLEECVANDHALLEDYITNIGNAVGKEYTIRWVYRNQPSAETLPDSP